MQNKANFGKTKMNLRYYSTKDYENKTAFELRKNKPNQTQFLFNRSSEMLFATVHTGSYN